MVALRLLTVHAHPDDEASKGAGTVARYRDEGIGATLVCCTGGEEGEILNPAMNRPEVTERLAQVRREELDRSVAAIGYDSVDVLAYRDSGMPDSEANRRQDNFANAPLDEAVEALVRIIRRDRPQVIVTYGDDQKAYGHPDHLKVHDISHPAFDRAGDAAWYPDAGEPWAPSKLYYVVWYRKRIEALHEVMVGLGLESPFDEEWRARWEQFDQDHRITTFVDVRRYVDVRRQALLSHATQVDPESRFWFGVPDDLNASVEPYDTYILAASRVATDLPESDLFAGLRGG